VILSFFLATFFVSGNVRYVRIKANVSRQANCLFVFLVLVIFSLQILFFTGREMPPHHVTIEIEFNVRFDSESSYYFSFVHLNLMEIIRTGARKEEKNSA
jgi:hypothetical protein